VVLEMEAQIQRHLYCKPGQWHEPQPTTPDDWRDSRDVGISSMTIYFAMTGNRKPSHCDAPHDPADFGRCYRLLKLAPQWRADLAKLAVAFPAWLPFVLEWETLERLYEKAILTPEEPASELFDFMQKLRKGDQ